MSKNLLKKSLAFVKSRNHECDSVKAGEKAEKIGVKRKYPSTQNQNSTAEVVSHVDKSMLYFTQRKRMKRKVANTVAKRALPERRGKCLTPSQLAQEKRKFHLNRRKNQQTAYIKAEKKLKKRKQFSILNIPHLNP